MDDSTPFFHTASQSSSHLVLHMKQQTHQDLLEIVHLAVREENILETRSGSLFTEKSSQLSLVRFLLPPLPLYIYVFQLNITVSGSPESQRETYSTWHTSNRRLWETRCAGGLTLQGLFQPAPKHIPCCWAQHISPPDSFLPPEKEAHAFSQAHSGNLCSPMSRQPITIWKQAWKFTFTQTPSRDSSNLLLYLHNQWAERLSRGVSVRVSRSQSIRELLWQAEQSLLSCFYNS